MPTIMLDDHSLKIRNALDFQVTKEFSPANIYLKILSICALLMFYNLLILISVQAATIELAQNQLPALTRVLRDTQPLSIFENGITPQPLDTAVDIEDGEVYLNKKGKSLGKLLWVKPQELNRGLPCSIELYTLNTDSSPFYSKLTGAYAKINMNDTKLEFLVKHTNSTLGQLPKTPMEFAAEQENVVYAVINAGYFDVIKNISTSFIAERGNVVFPHTTNIQYDLHPTVGAFGINPQGKFETQFIYSYGESMETYKFKAPHQYPAPPPKTTQGKRWKVNEGVDGGPILIKSSFIIKENLENFKSNFFDQRHPRAAVCIDSINNLYLVAIDGRQSESDGLTINQLAQLMQDLNCWDAMNLDGGGSTLLYANNKIVNKLNDDRGPRPVVSVIMIRNRTKKK